MVLQFIDAEKRIHDALVFPSFNMAIGKGQVVAIHSSVNIREQLTALLLGTAKLSQGELLINGDGPNGQTSIGFLFLQIGLYERLSIQEMLHFTKRLYTSTASIQSVLESVQLDEKRKEKIKQLPFSERKRVQLACLLIQNPDVYVLEEPDQNLDLESKRIYISVLDQLRNEDKAVLILTGNLENAIIAADTVFQLDGNGLQPVQIGTAQGEPADTVKEIELSQPVRFEKIPTKVKEKIVLFNPPEIDYIESNEGQSFLHIKGEAFPSVFTLQELEERLLPFGFFRCHRSYIVNLQKVREVITWTRNSYSLVLEDAQKSTIPLSKSKMAELKEMLGLK